MKNLRAWVVFLLGLGAGVCLSLCGCAEQSTYISLTEFNLQEGYLTAFPGVESSDIPVRGNLDPGTHVKLEGIKGGDVYFSVQCVASEKVFDTIFEARRTGAGQAESDDV